MDNLHNINNLQGDHLKEKVVTPVWRTVSQAAQLIGLSERQVWRQISSGKVPTKVNEAGARLVDISAKCHDIVSSKGHDKSGISQTAAMKLRAAIGLLLDALGELDGR